MIHQQLIKDGFLCEVRREALPPNSWQLAWHDQGRKFYDFVPNPHPEVSQSATQENVVSIGTIAVEQAGREEAA
jgi:hypothetical protein